MILQSLYNYYDRLAKEQNIPEFGFSIENVGFILEIDEKGNFIQEHDIRIGEGNKARPKLMEIPYSNKVNVRAVNIQPNFMVDKAAYLIGNDTKTKPLRIIDCHSAFIKLLNEVLIGVADDGAKAVLAFYKNWNPHDAPKILKYWEDISSDKAGFIAFKLSNQLQYIHLRPKIRNAWQNYLNNEKSKLKGQCLLCGAEATDIQQLHAQFKGISGGQSSGKSLVSFNIDSSESYGKIQSFNAPVSIQSEFKSSTALKSLIHSEKQHLYIGETYTVFWTERDSPIEGMFGMMLNSKDSDVSDNAELRQVLESVREGKQLAGIDKEIKFYILGLSPNAARLAVRFWYVCFIEHLEDNIGQHFRDLRIQKSRETDPEFPGIWRLLRETVNQKSSDKSPQPLLAGTLMRSILDGTAYPQVLQNSVMIRIRADQEINYIRAAILKAILVRKYRLNKQRMEVSMALDKENKNQAYLLGRLFATLEKAQQDAIGKNINATIKDRFFGLASATPKVVFPQLLRLAQHWVEKADYGKVRDKEIEEIVCHLNDFPAHLSLDEQGLFAIGYYHQRQDFFKRKDSPKNNQQ